MQPELLAVENPAVLWVIESATGEERSAKEVIGADYAQLMQLRTAVKESNILGEPRYLCAECFTPVYLVQRPDEKRFFFRHQLEDGRCSAITRGELSQRQIAAIKYNGLKESLLHRQMKQWLVDSLHASGDFTDIHQESRWQGSITDEWRKPDVSAIYHGIPIAFEVQLSTTFLDVIVERRLFYLKEGVLLFWVLAKFDDEGRPLTVEDLFFNNNQNAFIVSESTRDASLAARAFMLDCVWATAAPVSGLERQRVSFRELTLDLGKQQAFFYDYAAEHTRMEAEEAEERAGWPAEFERWWLEVADRTGNLYDQEAKVNDFPNSAPRHWNDREMLSATPLQFYGQQRHLPIALLDALYSVKHGRPVGIQRKQFIEVGHWFAPSYPRNLLWFRRALSVWDRGDLLKAQDKSGNWHKRVRGYTKEMQADPKKYAADQQHQRLVEWLFPELLPLPLIVQERQT